MPVYKKRTRDRAVILLPCCEFVLETAATDESLCMNSEGETMCVCRRADATITSRLTLN